MDRGMSVTLIGPGGAGKSTVGAALAKRLGLAFIDLDRRFADRNGNISAYISQRGYQAYARANVDIFASVLPDAPARYVAALSSGFMTYARTIHPDYTRIRHGIEMSAATFVLIPSVNHEQCVRETVRRQLGRPFARSVGEEEAVIRERFPLYMGLVAPKIETMRPLDVIVQDLLSRLEANTYERTSGAEVRRRSPASEK